MEQRAAKSTDAVVERRAPYMLAKQVPTNATFDLALRSPGDILLLPLPDHSFPLYDRNVKQEQIAGRIRRQSAFDVRTRNVS